MNDDGGQAPERTPEVCRVESGVWVHHSRCSAYEAAPPSVCMPCGGCEHDDCRGNGCTCDCAIARGYEKPRSAGAALSPEVQGWSERYDLLRGDYRQLERSRNDLTAHITEIAVLVGCETTDGARVVEAVRAMQETSGGASGEKPSQGSRPASHSTPAGVPEEAGALPNASVAPKFAALVAAVGDADLPSVLASSDTPCVDDDRQDETHDPDRCAARIEDYKRALQARNEALACSDKLRQDAERELAEYRAKLAKAPIDRDAASGDPLPFKASAGFFGDEADAKLAELPSFGACPESGDLLRPMTAPQSMDAAHAAGWDEALDMVRRHLDELRCGAVDRRESAKPSGGETSLHGGAGPDVSADNVSSGHPLPDRNPGEAAVSSPSSSLDHFRAVRDQCWARWGTDGGKDVAFVMNAIYRAEKLVRAEAVDACAKLCDERAAQHGYRAIRIREEESADEGGAEVDASWHDTAQALAEGLAKRVRALLFTSAAPKEKQ